MYPDAVKKHLEKGGMLAWGIIPTSNAIREQTVDGLESKFESVMDNLAAQGIDIQLIREQAMITPTCGTGSMEPGDADKVFEMVAALTKRMKTKYKF
jgi:hypothetical protein